MGEDFGTRRNQYFVPGEGIAREVITSDICKYLDNDATVRPYNYQGRDGYMIYAYRNLTTAMMEDLKRDTVRWRTEQGEKQRRPRGGGSGGSGGRRTDREPRYDPYPSQNNGRAGPPSGNHDVAMEDYRNSATHSRRLQIQNDPSPMQMGAMPMDTGIPETSSPHGSDGYNRPPYGNPSPQHPPQYGMNSSNAGNYGQGMQNQGMYDNDESMYPNQQVGGGYDQRGHQVSQQGYGDHMPMSGMSGPGSSVPGSRGGYNSVPTSGPGPYQSSGGRTAGGGSNNEYYDSYPRNNASGGSRNNPGTGYQPDSRNQGNRQQYGVYSDSRSSHSGGSRRN